jgi:molybdopterin adenylyltransferase
VSDSRTPETDTNGIWLREAIAAAGHVEAGYRLVRDEPEEVTAALEEMAAGAARIIVFNGGTGIAPRDTTYDVLARRIEKPIPGFGELFRMLSWEQVGAAAMLSRATAGVFRGRVVFSVPGSPAAVRLAWERLIAPEIQHLAWLTEE